MAQYFARRGAGGLHFHFINPDIGNHVPSITQDAETSEDLLLDHLARGFIFEKDRDVLMDDDDFEQARFESSAMMTVDKFVGAGDIDPGYDDSSYDMSPDGDAGRGDARWRRRAGRVDCPERRDRGKRPRRCRGWRSRGGSGRRQ